MNEIITAAITSSVWLGVIIYLGIYAFKNPEKMQKWAANIMSLAAFFSKKYSDHATKLEVQGKINDFVRSLSDISDVNDTRVTLRWADVENDDIQFEDDEVILVMRDRGYKNKNFVHAAYFFTSSTLLRHTKQHLSPKQAKALDVYTTKKLVEQQNKSALEVFIRDFFQPLMTDDKVNKLIASFIDIDDSGFYEHILLTELSHLGSKTFLTKKDEAIVKEVWDLVEFLKNFSNREVGDDTVTDAFTAKYTRCSIKIVSTSIVRHLNKTNGPTNRVLKAFQSGIENVYVIGPRKDGGKEFIDKVCEGVIEQNHNLNAVHTKTFEGEIKLEGKKKKTKTYLVHLQDPTQVNYVIKDSMIKSVEDFEVSLEN